MVASPVDPRFMRSANIPLKSLCVVSNLKSTTDLQCCSVIIIVIVGVVIWL